MAFLKVISDPGKGQTFQIENDETVIGRSEDNAVTLDDPSVSGKHCKVIRSGNTYSVQDTGSTNGIRVNDKKVKEAPLGPGDVIALGSVKIRIDGDDMDAGSGEPERPANTPPPTGRVATPDTVTAPGSDRFGTRRDSRWAWRAVIAFLCVLALAALGWFFFRLFSG